MKMGNTIYEIVYSLDNYLIQWKKVDSWESGEK